MNRNILSISDLHLGEGLKLIDNNITYSQDLIRLDTELSNFLEYYTKNRIDDVPWSLIINGDMIDFMSVVVMPTAEEDVSIDEKLYGLGYDCEKSKIKLKTIINHHRNVFINIAKFVLAGNEIKIIVGNHDAELYYKDIQKLFIEEVHNLGHVECSCDEFAKNIKFYPWFYYKENFIYVEHGHQYDEYCSFDYFVYPLAKFNHKNHIIPSVGHIGMRYFVNRIPNYDPHVAEKWGFFDYIKWAFSGSGKNLLYCLYFYTILVLKTLSVWAHLRRSEKERKVLNEKEINEFAKTNKMLYSKLSKLHSLRKTPVARNLFKIINTYFLDRMFLITVAIILTFIFGRYSYGYWKIITTTALFCLAFLLNMVLNKIRFNAPSNVKLKSATKHINSILNVKYILFGHSHYPEIHNVNDKCKYINSGSWSIADNNGQFTYVVISPNEQQIKCWNRESIDN